MGYKDDNPFHITERGVEEFKNLSYLFGVDRKICRKGHCSASRGWPHDAEQWPQETDFSIHTNTLPIFLIGFDHYECEEVTNVLI